MKILGHGRYTVYMYIQACVATCVAEIVSIYIAWGNWMSGKVASHQISLTHLSEGCPMVPRLASENPLELIKHPDSCLLSDYALPLYT